MIAVEGPSYGSTITEGTVDSEVYAEILELSLQDTMAYYGFDKKTFRFQHGNASPHTPGATKRWFRHQGYSLNTVLDWPAQSPDLNPIEHVWHQLKLRLNKYPTRATTISELEESDVNYWQSFTHQIELVINNINLV
jgi:hydroxymethylpyrimidine pyrophosphatase-like HAD family hydrolase